jgi:hypothetical protein
LPLPRVKQSLPQCISFLWTSMCERFVQLRGSAGLSLRDDSLSTRAPFRTGNKVAGALTGRRERI